MIMRNIAVRKFLLNVLYFTIAVLMVIAPIYLPYWGWKAVRIEGFGEMKVPGAYEAEIVDGRLRFSIENGGERKVVLQEGGYEDGNSLKYKDTLHHSSNSSRVEAYEVRDTGETVYALALELYKKGEDGKYEEAVLYGSARDVSPKDLELMVESYTAEEFL
jgi:hypothetical protein